MLFKKEEIDHKAMLADGWIDGSQNPVPKELPMLVVGKWKGEVSNPSNKYGVWMVENGADIIGGDYYSTWASDILYWRPAPSIFTNH